MDKVYTPFRRITIPVYGSVDITGLIGVINNPSFQRLRGVRQLGLSENIFPGAIHTRFEHSLGAMAQCREFIYPMVRKDLFHMDLARTLEIAALLHDVGHAPFSHVFENLLHCYSSLYKNHNDRTRSIITADLWGPICDAGADPKCVADIAVKAHPSAQIISHKSIGAEKIAYVRADQHHCGFPPTPLMIGDLSENLLYLDNTFGVDERMVPRVMEIQRYYFSMYSEVYLRKGTLALERVANRQLQLFFEDGRLNPDDVWGMTDFDLTRKLLDLGAEEFPKQLYSGKRELLKAAVVLTLPGHESKELTRGKPILSLPMDKPSDFFAYYSDPRHVLEAERALSSELSIPLEDLVFACSYDPVRLLPQDVAIFTPDGQPMATLNSRYPSHVDACLELAKGVSACRVMVALDQRKRVADAARTVYDVLYAPLNSASGSI